MKLGMIARVGAGFILICSLAALCAMTYFLVSEGFTVSGVAFVAASVVGCYLFAYLTFKGKVPPLFGWLQ